MRRKSHFGIAPSKFLLSPAARSCVSALHDVRAPSLSRPRDDLNGD